MNGKADTSHAPSVSPQYVLGLLFFINLLNFYDRQILAVVTEPIRLEWQLSDAQLGWMSTAFTLLYAVVGLPLGTLADRVSRTKLLGVGVALWSAFTALTGMASGYWTMFAARMGVGIGEASCSPAANSLIGEHFPSERRSRAISVFMLGLPVGIMLSSVLSGFIAREYGWRMAFLLATVPGLLLAVLISRVKDHRLTAATIKSNAPMSAYAELWRIPALKWIVVSGALHNFVTYAVSAFLPAYLMRYHGASITDAGLIGGAMLGAAGAVSLVITGVVADRVRRHGAHARLYVGSVAMLVSAPLFFAALLVPAGDTTTFAAMIAVGWMLFYAYYVTVYPAIHDVVRAEMRGSAMAMYFFWMYLLGGAFGTAAVGTLSDYFARRAMIVQNSDVITESARALGLRSAFFVAPVLAIVLAAVLLIAASKVRSQLNERS